MTSHRNSRPDKTPSQNDRTSAWRRNLYAIWFAEFVAILGFNVVIPILPLYVDELGVTDERGVRLWAGLIYSAHAVTMAIFGPIWGALSDRYGRKMMVKRAMFGGSVVITLMGLAQNVHQLALLRALQGALTGTVTAATALVATNVPRKHTGYAMGLLQTAIYIGASAGPLLGGLIADSLGFRAAFTATGVLLVLAGLAVSIFVREPMLSDGLSQGVLIGKATAKTSLRQRLWLHFSPVLGSGALLAVLGVRLLMRLAARLPMPTLPLFVEAISPPGARIATITGLISGTSACAGAIGAQSLGRLSDRVSNRLILISCSVASVICYIPQSLVNRAVWLALLQAGAGLAMGGILATITASLAELTPPGREGIVYGVDASVVSIANALGPITGSLLAASLGLRVPFLVTAGIFALAGAAASRLRTRR